MQHPLLLSGRVSMNTKLIVSITTCVALQCVMPFRAMSQEAPPQLSISFSEDQLASAHSFLDGCLEAFDAIPVAGPVLKGVTTGVTNLTLPTEAQINHRAVLMRLGTVNSRLMDMSSTLDEIRESVNAAPEQQFYVECRTLYSQLIDNSLSLKELELKTTELETGVYNASHLLELRPRGLVFYLAVSNAAFSLNYLQEACIRLKASDSQQSKLKTIASRIEQILNTCSLNGYYSPDNCRELRERYDVSLAVSKRLLAEAGLKEDAVAAPFAVNTFAFTGWEPDGKPDIEYSILRLSREEKWRFKSSAYGLRLTGMLIRNRNGFETPQQISLAELTPGLPESPISTITVDSEGELAKRTLEERIRERIDAYNASIAQTNEACAACVVMEAATKLLEMNKRALTTSTTGR